MHDWSTMVSNVQDHIRGLNFGYKVALRDEGVTYLNKLGKFVGKNELEVVDKKGRASVISAARFVIAVGGRPTRLDIPGGEHAISSDDLFMLVSHNDQTHSMSCSLPHLQHNSIGCIRVEGSSRQDLCLGCGVCCFGMCWFFNWFEEW